MQTPLWPSITNQKFRLSPEPICVKSRQRRQGLFKTPNAHEVGRGEGTKFEFFTFLFMGGLMRDEPRAETLKSQSYHKSHSSINIPFPIFTYLLTIITGLIKILGVMWLRNGKSTLEWIWRFCAGYRVERHCRTLTDSCAWTEKSKQTAQSKTKVRVQCEKCSANQILRPTSLLEG